MRHPIETLWREVGLPEYFLGNDGSNTKLYALYDAILARSSERTDDSLRKDFERVVASLNYDGEDTNSLTVGEIRRALP